MRESRTPVVVRLTAAAAANGIAVVSAPAMVTEAETAPASVMLVVKAPVVAADTETAPANRIAVVKSAAVVRLVDTAPASGMAVVSAPAVVRETETEASSAVSAGGVREKLPYRRPVCRLPACVCVIFPTERGPGTKIQSSSTSSSINDGLSQVKSP